jgi:hypothetical protein
MISLFLRFDLFFGWRLGGRRRGNLELFKLPQFAVQGFWEVLGRLSHVCDDIREEFLTVFLVEVSRSQVSGRRATYARRPTNNIRVLPGKSKEIPNEFWVNFVGRAVCNAEDQDGVGRRNGAEQAKEGCNYSVTQGMVPRLNARQINDAWLVSLYLREQLYNCGFRRLDKLVEIL